MAARVIMAIAGETRSVKTRATDETAGAASPVDPAITQVLRHVIDPELGLNIVDLGLVYAALWTPTGMRVVVTMTSPSCPMADLMVDDIRAALSRAFPDVADIAVARAFSPPWSPERISEAGRLQLGWKKAAGTGNAAAISATDAASWASRLFASFRRH